MNAERESAALEGGQKIGAAEAAGRFGDDESARERFIAGRATWARLSGSRLALEWWPGDSFAAVH